MGEILTIDGGEESKKPREKYILDGISNFFRYGICSMKGWRKTMEDKFLIKLNIGPKKSTHIFGIFDGHGGREVSKFISDHFVEEFLKNENYEKGDIKTCLKETFLNLDKKLLEQSSMQEMTEDHFLFMQEFNLSEESEINIIEDNGYKYIEDISYTRGSAAIVLVIHNHTELYFANIGDSRGIIIRNGNNFVRMTNDHKPNNNDEKKRIKKLGVKY